MSDLSLQVSVDNLINMAMGPPEKNTVNFKMLQKILTILARHMSMLETKVQIAIPDDDDFETSKREKKKDKSTKKQKKLREKEQRMMEKMTPQEKAKYLKEKAEEEEKLQKMTPQEKKAYFKEKEKREMENMSPEEKERYLKEKEELEMEDMTPREKEKYLKDKEERKMAKMSPKEKDKYLKEKEEEREMAKMSTKEKEEYLKEKVMMSKMTPKEKDKYLKEKEQREMEKMSPKDKERYLKDKEDREIAKMSPKEKEKYLKEKEEREMEKMSPKEKKEYLKEKEIMSKMSPKEKDKYLKEKEERVIEKMSPKEKEKYLKEKEEREMAKMSPKEKEEYLEEKEIISKMSSKDKEKYLKEKQERELAKMSPKEKERYLTEKEEREMAKMSPKEKEKYLKQKEEIQVAKMSPNKKEEYLKEKEMLSKMTSKEKEKYLKEKEEREMTKMSPKEREKYLKEKEEREMAKMSPKEKEEYLKQKEERAKVSRKDTKGPRRRGSGVDVVTQSEFKLLEDVVMGLKKKAGPLPMPTLPDSKQLKKDLATGRASLTDTMTAMQVSGRMQAAEQALARMTGMLTQLAVSGALPEEFAKKLKEVKADMDADRQAMSGYKSTDCATIENWWEYGQSPDELVDSAAKPSRKSVAIDPLTNKPLSMGTRPTNRASMATYASGSRIPVTHNQMDNTLQRMKEDLMKKVQAMTQRATITAEAASGTTKAIADNIDAVMNMSNQINTLYSLSTNNAEKLASFGSTFTTQMQSLSEEMMMMNTELKEGLAQLTSVNNNPETLVLMELKECYEDLSIDLDETLTAHQNLSKYQRQLGEELQFLMAAVVMLEEEKADREEMLEGLRNKADKSKLDGLVSMKRFESIRMDLEIKLRACYTNFSKQEATWTSSLQDLIDAQETKAGIMELLIMQGNAKNDLQAIQDRLKDLAIQLGEPEAAILMRLLSKDGRCAACKVEALMVPTDPACCQPHQLPALRPPPAEEPCEPKWNLPEPIDTTTHLCKRWVGGSHTLVCSDIPRLTAAPPPPPAPSHHYTSCGTDGRPYKMAAEQLPCIAAECTKQPPLKRRHRKYDIPKAYRDAGGGDNKKLTTKIREPVCDCLPTINIE